MAELLQDGSIRMRDGRILWGKDIVQIIDICELAELLVPAPKSLGGVRGFGSGGGGGFGGGGGGGRGAKGDPGAPGAAGPAGPPGSSGPINQIQDEGINLPVESILNFMGNGVQAVDNPGFGRTDITINDLYAATRIVSLVAGQGTDLTIAAAIANLPAEGGLIFVKEGTYPITATLALTDKPIDIVGTGGATVLDMGANLFTLFTKSFRHRYRIVNLTVVGTGVAGQAFFEDAVGDGSFSVDVESVTIDMVQTGFISTFGSLSLRLSRVDFNPALGAPAQFFTGGVGSNRIEATGCSVVGATVDAFVEIVSSVCHLDFTQSSGPVVNSVSGLVLAACSVAGEFAISGGRATQIVGCSFTYGIFGTPPDRYLDLPVAGGFPAVITGNDFVLPATFQEIRNAGDFVFVSGNTGFADLPIVTETGVANNNHYQDISFSSTILGNATIIDHQNARIIAASVTLDETHRTVLIDATAAPRVVSLPTAASARNRIYTVKKMDATANTVTIDPAGAETIDGAATQVLTTQYETITIQSNGTEWVILVPLGSGGGTSELILVEKHDFVADATSYQFTGLDGDTDNIYKIIWELIKATAGITSISLEVNGSPANLKVIGIYSVEGAGPAAYSVPSGLLNSNNSGNTSDPMTGNLLIHAHTGRIRQMEGQAVDNDAGGSTILRNIALKWNDSVSNITDLTIISSVANGILAGSRVSLYKMPNG